MVYRFGSLSFQKELDIIQLIIKILFNDQDILHNKKVLKKNERFLKYFLDYLGVLPFDYVLYPRSGATVAAIKALKDKLDAIYDITVMYNQTYDDQRQIHLAAPSMAGKLNFFCQINRHQRTLVLCPIQRSIQLSIIFRLE